MKVGESLGNKRLKGLTMVMMILPTASFVENTENEFATGNRL